MSQTDQQQVPEIIFIRRSGGGHEDAHHGGVWKIAFADFMTALMAFFLVMWLVNAANESTKVQVASYFNPVKLTDVVATKKGVNEPGPFSGSKIKGEQEQEGEESAKHKPETPASSQADETQSKTQAGKLQFKESQLFADPYAVLSEIAGETGQGEPIAADVDQGLQTLGLVGGQAYRDPFDPKNLKRKVSAAHKDQSLDADLLKELAKRGLVPMANETDKPEAADGPEVADGPEAADGPEVADGPQAADGSEVAEGPEAAGEFEPADGPEVADGPQAAGELETEAKPEMTDAPQVKPSRQANPAAPSSKRQDQAAEIEEPKPNAKERSDQAAQAARVKERAAEANRLAQQLKAGIDAPQSKERPGIRVEAVDEGLLISLTDGVGFGMFESASAQPTLPLIRLMEHVADALKDKPGEVVIRGHTDSRPFRTETYDNWRLSTARAHMAYHMLGRGGFDQARVQRIEGRADRDPLLPEDPTSAPNRRIEILLMEPKQ